MIDITPLITAAIQILVGIIAVYLAPKISAFFQAKLNAEDRKRLLEWTRIAVRATEQVYKQEPGYEKKLRVRKFLNDHGFDVNGKEVSNAIEAAVQEMNSAEAVQGVLFSAESAEAGEEESEGDDDDG